MLERNLTALKCKVNEWQAKEIKFMIDVLGKTSDPSLRRKMQMKLNLFKKQKFNIIYPHTNDGILELKSRIATFTKSMQVPVPVNDMWHDILLMVALAKWKLKRPLVSIDEALEVYKQVQLKHKTLLARLSMHIPGLHAIMTNNIQHNFESCLHILNDTGLILWYPTSKDLQNVIFIDINKVVTALHWVFYNNFQNGRSHNAITDHAIKEVDEKALIKQFKSSGIICEYLLKAAWGEENYKEYTKLMQMLDLCFQVKSHRDNPSNQAIGERFFFPRLISTEDIEGPSNTMWPEVIPTDTAQLELRYVFCHCLPSTMYERLSVKLQHHLILGADMRQDWKNTVYVKYNCMQIVIKRHNIEDHPYIQVLLRAGFDNLVELYTMCQILIKDTEDLMDYCPGVCADAFLVCPHCTKLHAKCTKHWRLEVVNSKPERNRKDVHCEATENGPCTSSQPGTIPAGMVMLHLISKWT